MVLGNLACVTHGACMVSPSEGFDPIATLEAVQAEGYTGLHGVPTMFIAMLDHPEFGRFDLRTLRTGIMAGSPCPVEAMRRVIERMHMREVTIAYGMTETSPVSFQSAHDDPLERRVSTVGRIQPHVEVKIVDWDGCIVPPGVPGELLAGLQRHARLLGRSGRNRGSHRRSALHAHRGSRDHRCGRLLQHCRPPEGHDIDHPRRRKYLSARGRGISVHPPAIGDVQAFGVPDDHYGEEL